MRAAVLFDEAAEGVDLRADRNAGDMIARQREGCLQRPGAGLGIEHLMEIAIDAMARIAGDHVDLALTFDHGVFAGRDRQPRLLDPFPWIDGLGRNAGHVAVSYTHLTLPTNRE